MTKYQFIQRLQNSPLTSWLWRYWHHKDTGNTMMLIFWKNPGKRWYKVTGNYLMHPNEERLKRLKGSHYIADGSHYIADGSHYIADGSHYTVSKSEFGSFESSNRPKKG